jgi:hypothetical protein
MTNLTGFALKPLKRWLNKAPPESAHHLTLSVAGLADTQVQTWSRHEYENTPPDVLAKEMLEASDGHAESVGRECRYTIRWLTEEEQVVIAMQWRAGDGMERTLDGSADSQIAQLQRHLEAMAKLNHAAVAQNLEVSGQLIESQARRIRELETLRDTYEAQRTVDALTAHENGEKGSKLEETLLKLLPMAFEKEATPAPKAS